MKITNKDEESEFEANRRRVLNKTGSAMILGGLATHLSGIAGADGNGSTVGDGNETDGSVGTDQYTTAPDGGGMTDPEWSSSDNEIDNQEDDDLYVHPNPGDLPIDVCVDMTNGNSLCITTADWVQVGTRPCPYGPSPELYSVDVTIQEYDSGALQTDFSIWVGVDDNNCIWIGQEETELCFSGGQCQMDHLYESVLTDPTSWIDALQESVDWIDNHQQELVYAGVFLSLIALVVLAPYLGAIFVGLMATAGSVG